MYLKRLYQHNKLLFAVILLFIICQLFINFKRGSVVSPFYHYGMYSEVMKPKDNYPVFEITVDGELLRSKDLTAQQWDKIMQPLVYYSKHKQSNTSMFEEVQRITGISDTAKYVSNVQKKEFFDWYMAYLGGIRGSKIQTLTVQQKNLNTGR